MIRGYPEKVSSSINFSGGHANFKTPFPGTSSKVEESLLPVPVHSNMMVGCLVGYE
jgi:hypothetical protein